MNLKSIVLQLTALRQSRGISLNAISEQTKISRYYLQAIEDLDFDKLPSGIYRNSFLLQYARAIDEDVAEELKFRMQKAAREAMEAEARALANHTLARYIKEKTAQGLALLFLVHGPSSAAGQTQTQASTIAKKDDPRLRSLRKFFGDRNCPIGEHSADFLAAADRHGLDWRLLPSIAFLESSGGKHLKNRNPLGWASGKVRFQSLQASIYHVAERLANSPIYAGKDLRTKLKLYNPARSDYYDRVTEIMNQLSPPLMAGR
ncbi:MAG: helix-turn-helix domain-containing protein [Bryobacteraceae bacterium]|nr:helix-turn-helix domain-containing protein [Bryobacteraceae bacterium]MDW8379241.1 helix-turn-helix transcriptional regulator [Bryobacterales bacterium]